MAAACPSLFSNASIILRLAASGPLPATSQSLTNVRHVQLSVIEPFNIQSIPGMVLRLRFLSLTLPKFIYKSDQIYSTVLVYPPQRIYLAFTPSKFYSAIQEPFSPPSLVNSQTQSVLCIESSNDATYCHRSMRTFNFVVLAVLSYIAMVGAIPIGDDAPAGRIARRQLYVP
jgi:hypothetical protein